MKAAFLSLLVLVTSASIGFAQEAKQVTSEEQFQQTVVGKKWRSSWGDGWIKINKDGTFAGEYPAGALKGEWYWKGKTWCRKGKVGSKEIPEECQKYFTVGKNIMKNVTKSKPEGTYYYLD